MFKIGWSTTCLSEMLMTDSNKGATLVRIPDRTEGDNISKEHYEGFILPITVNGLILIESFSTLTENSEHSIKHVTYTQVGAN